MAYKLEIQGLAATLKKINKLANTVRADAQDELNTFADNVSRMAKRLAPGDEGHLRGAINPIRGNGNLESSVVAAVVYAAFMEFGTRKFAAAYVATLPQDWQQYASTFKGQSGGSFDEFLKAIMAWVKRKGIDDKAAYPIALKILREGVRPQPFLYPSIIKYLPELKKGLQSLLDK